MKQRHTFKIGDRVIWGTGGDDYMGVVESLTPTGRPRVRGRLRFKARPATPQEWADYVASRDARRVVRGLSTVEYAWLSQISAVDRAALANQLCVALAELERIEQARREVAP